MLPEAGLCVLHHLAGAGGGCIVAGLLGEGGHGVLGVVTPAAVGHLGALALRHLGVERGPPLHRLVEGGGLGHGGGAVGEPLHPRLVRLVQGGVARARVYRPLNRC